MKARYVVITQDNQFYSIFDTKEDQEIFFTDRDFRKRYGFFGPQEVSYHRTMYSKDKDWVVQTCKRLNMPRKEYLASVGCTFLEEEN